MAHSIPTVAETGEAGRTPACSRGAGRRGRERWAGALGLIVVLGLAIRLAFTYVHGGNLATLGIDAGYYDKARICSPTARQSDYQAARTHRRRAGEISCYVAGAM